jgi:hypothetical protein
MAAARAAPLMAPVPATKLHMLLAAVAILKCGWLKALGVSLHAPQCMPHKAPGVQIHNLRVAAQMQSMQLRALQQSSHRCCMHYTISKKLPT